MIALRARPGKIPARIRERGVERWDMLPYRLPTFAVFRELFFALASGHYMLRVTLAA